MTDDGIVHLVESLDGDFGNAQPVPVSELDQGTNYACLARKSCGTPIARYHPRPGKLIAGTLTSLPKGERLYVAPVERRS